MATITTLTVTVRERVGKGAARATRNAGFIPGVIYGNKQAPIAIALEPRALWSEMNKPGFRSRLFNIPLDGGNELVLCRDVQRHPVQERPLHVDFLRVAAESKVHVRVPVHFANQDRSPGLKKGGVLNIVAHEIEVIVLANAIPSELVIDLSGLEIGTSIHLSTLNLPEGVIAVTHEKDPTLATIAAPTVAPAGTETPAASA